MRAQTSRTLDADKAGPASRLSCRHEVVSVRRLSSRTVQHASLAVAHDSAHTKGAEASMGARPIDPIALALAISMALALAGVASANDTRALSFTPQVAATEPAVVLKPDAPDSAARLPAATPKPAAKAAPA